MTAQIMMCYKDVVYTISLRIEVYKRKKKEEVIIKHSYHTRKKKEDDNHVFIQ